MRSCRQALLALVCLPSIAFAESATGDASVWLEKIARAPHHLNYAGTFVYQHGNYMETSRITHVFDESGEHEKLEMLDGPPKEIIRNNDDVVCFRPESRGVIVEKRRAQKNFPALLPRDWSGIVDNYQVRLGGLERIAGYECQNVVLEPRDIYRYGHRFCAERASSLLLKASTLNEKNEIVDQFSFTQVDIGGTISRDQLKPRFSLSPQISEPIKEAPADPGWVVKAPPAGFKKIIEAKRFFPGKKFPANHLVFSDRLAAVSVFIEPLAGLPRPMNGLSSQGAINVFTKPVLDYQVTVLGEVPTATVIAIGNSVTFIAK